MNIVDTVIDIKSVANLDFCLDNVPVLGESVVALPGAPAQVQAPDLADTQGPATIL